MKLIFECNTFDDLQEASHLAKAGDEVRLSYKLMTRDGDRLEATATEWAKLSGYQGA